MLKFFREMKARRMNKIVDEVRQELLAEFLLISQDGMKEFVDSRINSQEIDYDELARNVDYSDIAYHIDRQELADEISTDDIAYHIDLYEIASNIDVSDVAEHFDHYTLAQEIDVSNIAEYIDLDSRVDDLRDDIISEVEGMISDAVDELEITRG